MNSISTSSHVGYFFPVGWNLRLIWDTSQLQDEFEVLGFMAPLVVARRRSDGTKGSLMFQANPRFYFGWSPE